VEVNGQLHAPAALAPRKDPTVPAQREAGWILVSTWTLCKEVKSLASARCWTQTFHRPARRSVTIL